MTVPSATRTGPVSRWYRSRQPNERAIRNRPADEPADRCFVDSCFVDPSLSSCRSISARICCSRRVSATGRIYPEPDHRGPTTADSAVVGSPWLGPLWLGPPSPVSPSGLEPLWVSGRSTRVSRCDEYECTATSIDFVREPLVRTRSASIANASISNDAARLGDRLPRWPPWWLSVVIGVGLASVTAAASHQPSPSYYVGLALVVGACHRFNHMLVNELVAIVAESRRNRIETVMSLRAEPGWAEAGRPPGSPRMPTTMDSMS